MNPTILAEIESYVDQLSPTDQLWLLEHVAQRLRKQLATSNNFKQELAAMTADKDIQKELREIDAEFGAAR
jgi:hypothetical protein